MDQVQRQIIRQTVNMKQPRKEVPKKNFRNKHTDAAIKSLQMTVFATVQLKFDSNVVRSA